MRVNRTIFREYDIRGIAGRDLTGETALLIGRAFGTWVRRHGGTSVAVGGDNRLTTPGLKEQAIRGLLSSGCLVADCGIVPSPMVYFAARHRGLDAAMVVTASHNPPEFNGFKTVFSGKSLHGGQIGEIADIIEKEAFVADGGAVSPTDAAGDYLAWMRQRFCFSGRLRIGVDTGNGTAGPFLVPLLRSLGAQVHALYEESDPSFPHHLPDPVVPEHLKDLVALVLKEHLDAGIALDGDGDRIGVVDDRGRILWGDRLLILFAREVLAAHPGAAVIYDVKCTKALEEEIRKAGGQPVMWKTGHSLIEGKLHELHAPLAGELSGHIYFADEYFGYDDAIYAALRLLRMLDDTDRPLSDMLAGVKEYAATPEIRMEVPDEEKFGAVERLRDHFRGRFPVSDIDGVKVFFPDGWALVRASNTQPALVLRIEAENEAALARIRAEFLATVRGVVPVPPAEGNTR